MGDGHPYNWSSINDLGITNLQLDDLNDSVKRWLVVNNLQVSFSFRRAILRGEDTENPVFWIDLGTGWTVSQLEAGIKGIDRLSEELATWIAELSNSYRLRFGAVIWTLGEEGQLSIFFSCNSKMRGPSYPKFCAELSVLGAARHTGHSLVLVLFIRGPLDFDAPEGSHSFILEPCQVCRQAIRSVYRDMFEDWTRLVCAASNADYHQKLCIAVMMQIHHLPF